MGEPDSLEALAADLEARDQPGDQHFARRVRNLAGELSTLTLPTIDTGTGPMALVASADGGTDGGGTAPVIYDEVHAELGVPETRRSPEEDA